MKYLLELTITKTKGELGGLVSYDKVEGDSLVQVLSQFQMVLGIIAQKQKEYLERHMVYDDDIPF